MVFHHTPDESLLQPDLTSAGIFVLGIKCYSVFSKKSFRGAIAPNISGKQTSCLSFWILR